MAISQAGGYNNLPTGNWLPVIYSQKVQKFFRTASVVEDITNTDYAGEIENYGDTVNIVKEPTITVAAYTRGGAIATQNLADDQLQMVVDQANAFAFKVDDIEERQSHVNWEALATSWSTSANRGSSTARYGCCPAGSFMANPFLDSDPFSDASSCAICSSGSDTLNDDTICTGDVLLPDGDSSFSATGTEGTLRRVVSDWIAGGTLKKAVVATYGEIEDWNLARVTNMESVFYNFTTFNGDISSWNVSGVANLKLGMYAFGFLYFIGVF